MIFTILRLLALLFLLCGGAQVGAAETAPPVTVIRFAPDGQSCVAGSQAGLVQYAWPSLTRLRHFDVDVENIHDMRFSPDGAVLAVSGGIPAVEGRVAFFEWPSGVSVHLSSDHDDAIMGIAWRNNQQFASAGLDRRLLTCRFADGFGVIRQFNGHSRGVTTVTWIESLLVSAGIDQSLRVWDTRTGQVVRTLNNHTQRVNQLARRPGKHALPMVASASDDRTVRFWQPTIGRLVRFVKLSSVPLDLAWLPTGATLVVATADGYIHAVDPDTARLMISRMAVDGRAYSIAAAPDGRHVAVGGRHGQIRCVRLE